MVHDIRADYNQQRVLARRIEDWLDDKHQARFVRDFVDHLDLKKLCFKEHKLFTGRSPYSTEMKLKIWIYGYFKKMYSCRALAEATYENVGMMFLTGENHPSRNVIWEFWDMNKKAIRKVFREVTHIAKRTGRIGMVLHALDGTKIQGAVSNRTGMTLDDLKREQAYIDSAIDEIMEIIKSRKKKDDSMDLEQSCEVLEINSLVLDSLLSELDAIGRDHINPLDLDARMMKCGKTTEFAYNAQAVVDEESGLIVAEDVVNEESDNNMLTPMIEQVEENLGGKAEETVADGGFYSPEQLVKAEEAGMNVLVNISEQIEPKGEGHDYHKSKFSLNIEDDVIICPQGKALTFERVKNNRHNTGKLRIYRCHHGKDCPVVRQCTKDKHGRSIEIEPHYEVIRRQITKQKDPYKKELLAKRKQIVEPVFGIIKHCMGFRRFTVRGLENAKTQWSLICTTFDLRKLYEVWKAGKLVFA
ncbi:IS1182 family transposase [bacterium]|nr:IS1182 family transposase [bacterium]